MGPMVELGELDQQKVDKRFRVLPGNPQKKETVFLAFPVHGREWLPCKNDQTCLILRVVLSPYP